MGWAGCWMGSREGRVALGLAWMVGGWRVEGTVLVLVLIGRGGWAHRSSSCTIQSTR